LRLTALGLLLFGTACAQPYPAPTAMIVAAPPGAAPVACEPVKAPLEARIGEPVPVSAACSEDRSEGSLSYLWSLANAPAGAMPTLVNADAITPTFVPDVPGTFRLKLVVSNGVVASAPAFADIAVGPCGGHAPAVAASASNPSPHAGELVMLDASATDEDAAPACAAHAAAYDYAWSLVELPPGSRATLNATAVRAPSFVADTPGTYRARVVVTDPTGRVSQASEVRVEAGKCGAEAPVIAGITTSDAPESGDTLTLHATVADADTEASCAAHAAAFEYAWSFEGLPPGSRASLNDAGVAEPSFVADVAGHYSLRVVVTDPTGRQGTAAGSIVVAASTPGPDETACKTPPVAAAVKLDPGASAACGDRIIPIHLRGDSRILLDAAPSFDPDPESCGPQTLDYAWTLLATPREGGASALESTNGRTTVLHVTADGAYQVRLVVTDATGLSSGETLCWMYAGDVG
jgi:hypothetical protein